MQKANGTKRELSVLTLRDRIVQRAVCDLISPRYEAKFLECSFAYRPNRGVPHAIAQVAAIRAEGYEAVVHADIENFFDTMDSQILMRFLRASMKEPAILRLIQMWLDMGGILQQPKPPPWSTHIQNTAHCLGAGIEQIISQALQRGSGFSAPAASAYCDDGYDDILHSPIQDTWAMDEPDSAKDTGLWSQANKEALINLGRDGLLLLLANSKRIWMGLSAKHLLFAAPLVAAALAAPAVGGIVKEHLSRPRKIGIVQGSPLSPLLANIYLHPFDKAMTRAGIRMVRYADDLLLLCRSEGRAKQALQHAQKRLATLKLQLNPKKTHIAHFNDGVEFLGHVFDADGCYQPLPEPRTKALQTQVQRALKQGAAHAARSGQHITQRGKNVATQIGTRLKKTRQLYRMPQDG